MKITPSLFSSKSKNVPYRNKNVKLGLFDSVHKKEADELYYAQDVIGNYAKANNSKVQIAEAADYLSSPALGADLFISVEKENDIIGKGKLIKYRDDSGKPFIKRVYETVQSLTEGKETI